MIKNLAAFGCGWTWGCDIENPMHDSYPALIAHEHNWVLENCAEPGISLYNTIDALTSWINRSTPEHIAETLVIVGLTDEERSMGTVWPPEKIYEDVVTAINELAEEHNLNLLQFNVLSKTRRVKSPRLIESSSALEMLVIRDKPRKNPLFTEHKFPNEKGHVVISEFLNDKIDSVILSE